MLPPDDYSDRGEFDLDNYDPRVFESYYQAQEVYNAVGEWMHGAGGDFSQEDWFEMIENIHNYHEWVDDDGNYHVRFDFDWESPDGEYSGSGSYSG